MNPQEQKDIIIDSCVNWGRSFRRTMPWKKVQAEIERTLKNNGLHHMGYHDVVNTKARYEILTGRRRHDTQDHILG